MVRCTIQSLSKVEFQYEDSLKNLYRLTISLAAVEDCFNVSHGPFVVAALPWSKGCYKI